MARKVGYRSVDVAGPGSLTLTGGFDSECRLRSRGDRGFDRNQFGPILFGIFQGWSFVQGLNRLRMPSHEPRASVENSLERRERSVEGSRVDSLQTIKNDIRSKMFDSVGTADNSYQSAGLPSNPRPVRASSHASAASVNSDGNWHLCPIPGRTMEMSWSVNSAGMAMASLPQ